MAIFYCQSTRYPKICFSPGDFHRPIVGTSPCLGPISTCGSDQPCMASTDEIAENLRDFGTTRSIHENSNIKTHQNLCLKSWKPENHGENIKELPSWKVVSICFGLTRWLFSSWKRWLRTRDMLWYGCIRSIIDLGYLSQRRKPFKITWFIVS